MRTRDKSGERRAFDEPIERILRADPKVVESAVDAEIREHPAEREGRGMEYISDSSSILLPYLDSRRIE